MAQGILAQLLQLQLPLLASSNGPYEGDEGNEGFSEEGLCDDCNCGIPVCSRDSRSENKGGQKHHGSDHGHCGRGIEKDRILQVGRNLNMKLKKKPATPARKG